MKPTTTSHSRSYVTARMKFAALASVSAAALLGMAPAAQAQAPEVEEIIVTSTRLTTSGFNAPTPTTVIGSAELEATAKTNIFNAIVQLPSLQGSSGVQIGNGGTSGGTNGISSFNMRALGSSRALTLLDGQRVNPANVNGLVDVSMFPQLLIQRVDVVTGGASASYGSDAVAGVINFFTDKRFVGLKYDISGGVTTYGDGEEYKVAVAGGTTFAGGRGHIQVSLEEAWEDEIGAGDFGLSSVEGRTWYKAPQLQTRTIAGTPAGQPRITRILYGQNTQFAKFGLITGGPLQGTAFGPGGAPFQFQYGSNGTPSRVGATNSAVIGCISPWCQGGDLSGNVGNGTSIRGMLKRQVFYNRTSFEITPNLEVYATVNLAKTKSRNQPNPGAFKNANLTIQCANPYVPAATRAACVTAGITSFNFGTSNAQFPDNLKVHADRETQRYAVGALGNFDVGGRSWNWDAYYQYGKNDTYLEVRDITLTPRYNNALDAAVGPNNTIVCRNPVAQAAGCVPFNVLGDVPMTQAQWRYIAPENGPFQESPYEQTAAAFNLSGDLFEGWAGPIAFAAGVEYRKEEYSVRADAYGNGTKAGGAYNADFPADALLDATRGNNWYAGNFHNGQGQFDVKEGYAELGVPLFDSEAMGSADLQLAGRRTSYSTAGKVSTWKAGVAYDTPIDGIRLRAVRSRDIRAPNLQDLFAAPQVFNGTVNNPGLPGSAPGTVVTVLVETIGNPNLTPEIGTTTEFGIVLRNPTWLPGFSASVDYYKIDIQDAIASLSTQQQVDLCFQGNAAICPSVFLTGNQTTNPNKVTSQRFNLASVETDGIDLEVSYRYDLSNINLPGSFTARALATHVREYLQTSGIPGNIPRNQAGENTGSIPSWKLLATQTWDSDKWNVNLTQRWFSDGVLNNNNIECTSNCPVPTLEVSTIDDNSMKGALYVDVGVTYKWSEALNIYFKVDNLADRDPEPLYNPAPNNIGANPSLYETIGRSYRLGIRGTF